MTAVVVTLFMSWILADVALAGCIAVLKVIATVVVFETPVALLPGEQEATVGTGRAAAIVKKPANDCLVSPYHMLD